jgi:hypothetical protein
LRDCRMLLWPIQGASSLTSLFLSGGFLPRFFQAIRKYVLGVSGGPAIGQHLIELRFICMDPHEKFTQVDPWLDPMSLGTRHNGVQNRGAWSCLWASYKQWCGPGDFTQAPTPNRTCKISKHPAFPSALMVASHASPCGIANRAFAS